MTIKKGDFVELEYTGKVKDDGKVFDTTNEKIAEDSGLLHKYEPGHNHDHSDQFHPITACIGEKHLLPGLDESMIGKKIGKTIVELSPDKAFGKKDAKLLSMFPMTFFKKQEIQPYVGLQLTFDNGRMGTVRSVGAGRVMVDFNHPLAGREIVYDVDIKRIVEDKKEKLDAILTMFQIPIKDKEIKEKKVTIMLKSEVPEEYLKSLKEDIKRLTEFEADFKQPEKKKQ